MDERTGALSEAYNVRLEELCVLDMAWLAPTSKVGHTHGGTKTRVQGRVGPAVWACAYQVCSDWFGSGGRLVWQRRRGTVASEPSGIGP